MSEELKKLKQEALELCWEIEKFPASEHQTATSIRASKILSKLGELCALAVKPE